MPHKKNLLAPSRIHSCKCLLSSLYVPDAVPDTWDMSMNEPDQILPWQNLGSNEPVRGARRFGLPGVLPLGHPQVLSQPEKVCPNQE